MRKILIDRNMEGPASILWGMLSVEGWLSFFPVQLKALADLKLPDNSTDQTVWRAAQQHGMMLLTGNRNLELGDTLEKIIRRDNTPASLPVLSITRLESITTDRHYQELCLDRLLEILENVESYKGHGRIFLP